MWLWTMHRHGAIEVGFFATGEREVECAVGVPADVLQLVVSKCCSKSPCETSFIALLSLVIGSSNLALIKEVISPAINVLKIKSQPSTGMLPGRLKK